MASYTTNLNLKKPAGSENVAIGDINNNMDLIDSAYGTLNSKTVTNWTLYWTSGNLDDAPVQSSVSWNYSNAGNITNSPIPTKGGICFTFGASDSNKLQFVVDRTSGSLSDLKIRTKIGSDWGAWKTISLS